MEVSMEKEQQHRILEFLEKFFDPEGEIYFLAVADVDPSFRGSSSRIFRRKPR